MAKSIRELVDAAAHCSGGEPLAARNEIVRRVRSGSS